MILKMKQIKGKIVLLLSEKAHLRDDDNKLVANIWHEHLKKNYDLKNMSAMDLLQIYADDKLPCAESITRMRRKLQELLPELRGEKYEARQKQEVVIRNEITNL